jgi:hypothetical protein
VTHDLEIDKPRREVPFLSGEDPEAREDIRYLFRLYNALKQDVRRLEREIAERKKDKSDG